MNIAMIMDHHNNDDDDNNNNDHPNPSDNDQCMYYLIFPNYLLYSATSFEKFNMDVQYLLRTMSNALSVSSSASSDAATSNTNHNDANIANSNHHHNDRYQNITQQLQFTTYHPEHVQSYYRSPIPIFAIERIGK
jgi:hypothetical protein